jgi:murein L,D-transpeptidase YcbB/YkuD
LAAAFKVFLLAALLASGAHVIGARAEETPADGAAFTAPAETDQDAPSPASAPAGADETSASPAPASSGEDEPSVSPAEAPLGEEAREPAEATVTAVTPPVQVGPQPVPANPIVAEIKKRLQDPDLRNGAHADDLAALEAFYGGLGGAPLWITAMGFTAKAQALIAEMQKAGDFGLDPESFDLPAASGLPATAEAQAAAEIELALAALKYARFARGGRIAPARVSPLFDQAPGLRDPDTVLSETAAASDPGAYLRSLHPQHEQFERLRQALIKAVANAKARGRKPESDGAVQRLVVNMERWRWMPSNLGAYYVWNNVPSFTTRVVKSGKSIYVEKTIVGQVKYATPIFSADMNSIVFHPEWIVPDTIKIEDIQPRLRQGAPGGRPDLSVLRNNNLSVSIQGRSVDAATVDWSRANIHSYTFTQPAGPGNVLGVLKFNFPNRHAVYMHDTLQPALFNQTVRTLSHGCIRVHRPARLAALLLAEDKGWSEQRVREMIARGKNSAVTLSHPVPVHLTYFTVAFDGVGQMRTYADVYSFDRKMAAALFGKSELISAEVPVAAKPKKRRAANVGVGRPNTIPGLFGN